MVIDRRVLVPTHPKTLNNRAQFFLLAAVIISAIVISFGVTTNSATVTKEPEGFYYLGHNIKVETNAVLNYEVYSGFNDNDNLTAFVNLISGDIADNMQNAEFLFIYGDNKGIDLKYYGTKNIYVDGIKLKGPASKITSKICVGHLCQDIDEDAETFRRGIGKRYLNKSVIGNAKNISVLFDGQKFVFPISEYKKVIFIMKKDVNNESFVSVR